jgi:hypothetical protein
MLSGWQLAARNGLIILGLISGTSQIGRTQDRSTDNSWTANSRQSDPSGSLNPIRSHTTHSEVDGHVIDKTVTERLGPDGRYIPYSEIERESIRVNDTTVRTIERSYGTNPDGRSTLTQQIEEESHSSADGANKVTRTTSNPDANGALRVVQRAMIDSKVVSPDVRETKTTLFSANGSGGLGPTVEIEERERRTDASTVQFTKSTSLSDGAGHWTVSELREGTTRQEAGGRTKEESVQRPDSNGRLALVERTVSKQSQSGAGERNESTETFSTNVPGQAGSEGLRLVQRESTVERSGAGGESRTTRQVERSNPADPAAGLHVTKEAIDIVRPGADGVAHKQSTIVTTDANGRMNTVWVDMGSSNKPAAVSVDTSTRAKPKPAEKATH